MTVTPYGALAAAGLAIGLWIAFAGARRRGVETILTAKVVCVSYLVTVLATKCADWFLTPERFGTQQFLFANGWSGLGFPAGILFTWLIERALRRPAGDVVDSVALGMSPGIVLGRVGCLFAGCCGGVEIKSPAWRAAVQSVFGEGVTTHPTQIYNVLAFAAIAPVVALVHAKGPRGMATATFLFLFGTTRFAFGAVRTGFPPAFWGLNLDQAVALGTIAAASIVGALTWRGRVLNRPAAGRDSVP